MKIEDSTIVLNGHHKLTEDYNIEIQRSQKTIPRQADFQSLLSKTLNDDDGTQQTQKPDPHELELRAKRLAMEFVRILFEKLLGQSCEDGNDSKQAMECQKTLEQLKQTRQRPMMISIIHVEKSYHRSESTAFSASGQISTCDGKKLNIQLNMHMSHEYSQSSSVVMESIRYLDPLIINYDGPAAELEGIPQKIDLNLDGTLDEIAFPSNGSGILVLDKNENGEVDDGSEMFGPNTGHGFGELKKYDEDHNGWIDENDSIFNELKIWHQDSNGNNQLVSLSKLDVGAIYINAIDTPFRQHDSENNILGQIKKSGLFLKEDGTPGTIQEMDFKI